MTTILILASFICIASLFSIYRIHRGLKAREDEQKREAQERRRQAEMERQREEQTTRMREEWKLQQEQFKANLLRQKAILQEQEAARKEREMLAREQERQAKELARHAKELERHEEMIRKAQFTAEQAKLDIEFYNSRLADLYAKMDYLMLQQAGEVPGSKEHERTQGKIVTLNNQIHVVEGKLRGAEFRQSEASRKLA